MLWLQELARKAFEAQQEGWDKESSTLQQQKAALAKGGSQAAAVVKQIATWQASLPQAEQSLVQAPKGMLNFPVVKTRGAHAMNGIADKGLNKKKLKEDGPQADLQRTQIKNPVQVSCGDAVTTELCDICNAYAHYHIVCRLLWSKAFSVLDSQLVYLIHNFTLQLSLIGLCVLQELKELLDKHKWAQAEYSFQGQQDDGGHICHIAVRDAGITGIVSQPCQNQRSAKSSAASQALSILLQENLT